MGSQEDRGVDHGLHLQSRERLAERGRATRARAEQPQVATEANRLIGAAPGLTAQGGFSMSPLHQESVGLPIAHAETALSPWTPMADGLRRTRGRDLRCRHLREGR